MTVKAYPTLNRWNIPFVNQVKFLGVLFDRTIEDVWDIAPP